MTTDGRSKLAATSQAWDRAVACLVDSQGRVARNNARRAAMKALRAMRAALDQHYPIIGKQRKAPVKRSRLERGWHLLSEGYRPEHTPATIRRFLEAGVRSRRGPAVARWTGQKLELRSGVSLWFPTWAFAAETLAELREAKRSCNKREELRALFLIEQV